MSKRKRRRVNIIHTKQTNIKKVKQNISKNNESNIKSEKNIESIKNKSKKRFFLNLSVPIIYIIVPIMIMVFANYCPEILIAQLSTMKVSNINIVNSSYSVNEVISPFCKSISFLIGFIISVTILKILNKCFFKSTNSGFAKKCLSCIEIALVLLAVISVIYANSIEYPYYRYGYSKEVILEVEKVSAMYIPLEKIPSIKSLGHASPDTSLFYNGLVGLSQFFHLIYNNFDFFIAVAGAIIIPLKNYVDEENKMVKCKGN